MKIDEKIIQIISDQLNVNHTKLTIESELEVLPNWDSLNAIKIMTILEKNFDKKVALQNFFNAKKVLDLINLVK